MAHSRRGQVRRTPLGRGQRRQTLWLTGTTTRTSLAGGGSALVTSLNAAGLALRPFTIVRTRGYFTIASDQQLATEFYEGAVGSTVVTDQAVAAGVASVPTPISEDASDWFVYDRIADEFVFGDATGFILGSILARLDSRAMRKVDLGEDLITVIEASTLNTSGITITQYMRFLVKLH